MTFIHINPLKIACMFVCSRSFMESDKEKIENNIPVNFIYEQKSDNFIGLRKLDAVTFICFPRISKRNELTSPRNVTCYQLTERLSPTLWNWT